MSATAVAVGRLARSLGLSRSTLLYYDSIGLLRLSSRDASSGYRLYSAKDRRRLERIRALRSAGLSLGDIGRILDGPRGATSAILERRLEALNHEIAGLREQQRIVARLMKSRSVLRRARAMTKERWVAILKATGLSEGAMRRWHVEFERMAPEGHHDFLESLGLPPGEVRRIRRWSREHRRE